VDNGGKYPETVAFTLWGTDNIKTYGESLAQVGREGGREGRREGGRKERKDGFRKRGIRRLRRKATVLTCHLPPFLPPALPPALPQVLALAGVRPIADSIGRVNKLELIPVEELGRPRIDVVVSCSGVFRDLFINQVGRGGEGGREGGKGRGGALENENI
jgi:hypothetical protein